MKEEKKKIIKDILGSMILSMDEFCGDVSIEVPRDHIIDALAALKADKGLKFNFLSDLFAVDNLEYEKKSKKEDEEAPSGPRFEVVYLLLSLDDNERLQVKTRIPEDDLKVPSATSLWRAATWPEREAFDMYGIKFDGHHDLRRLLMWDEFEAHPLRKDYPLEGMEEERPLVFEEDFL